MLESRGMNMDRMTPQDAGAIDDPREAYETPELRDLGDLVDLTETLASGVGADGPYS